MNASLIQVESVLLTGVSAVVLGFALFLIGPRWRKQRGSTFAACLLLLLVCSGLAALMLLQDQIIAVALGALAALWALGWSLRATHWQLLVARSLACHHVQAFALILLGFGTLLGWGAWQDSSISHWSEDEQDAVLNELPPTITIIARARTDRGKEVPLSIPTTNDPGYNCSIKDETRILGNLGLNLQVIRTAGPSLESNCHGWVFAGGKYWVAGVDVSFILEDNGYSAIASPQAGDAIVYHDQDHHVVHTGVVRAVTTDGKVLIESKWGKMGGFLHAPETQTYSTDWQYYRSSRQSHILRGLPGTTEPSLPSTSH